MYAVWMQHSTMLTFYRELAELLGQVKPPTVSKDEIDKSGLEIIKAESLEEYQKDGRVATNCVDRVCNLPFLCYSSLPCV